MVGAIGNNQGDVAGDFFYNSMKENPSLGGIEYDFIVKNTTRSKGDTEYEYDLLLVNGKDVAIIETKYKAHKADVERLVNGKYAIIK